MRLPRLAQNHRSPWWRCRSRLAIAALFARLKFSRHARAIAAQCNTNAALVVRLRAHGVETPLVFCDKTGEMAAPFFVTLKHRQRFIADAIGSIAAPASA
jgi:hypothetical protein